MKLKDKALNYAKTECGININNLYPTSLSHTLGDVTIQDYSEGYNQGIKDLEQAIKANPKLTAKQILENLKKEI